MTNPLRISYRKNGAGWDGALTDADGKLVWTCGHRHENRDNGSLRFGKSARWCAAEELRRRELEEIRRRTFECRA